MKRVLCIVGGMNAGGAETFLMKVYRALDKTKYQMDFAVAISDKGYYDDEIDSLGGKIYHIPPKTKNPIKSFNAIRKLVKENKYEYVLRTSQHSLSALELLAARFGGAKTRVFRSSNSNTVSKSKKQMLLHKLCAFMPRRFANVRIAPSTEAADFMYGKNSVTKGRAQILKNAVDLNEYCFVMENREKIRKDFNIEKKKIIGHIGRFTAQKNHVFLIDIFHEIHKKDAETRLLLIGKGEHEKDVRSKVKDLDLEDSVIFAGVRADVPALLSAMDVFVMPSLYEGMPNTVIEAQATGLPCIIADTITREANITGLVKYLPLENPELWATAALDAVSEERADTKAAFIENKYDVESTARDFVKLVFGE